MIIIDHITIAMYMTYISETANHQTNRVGQHGVSFIAAMILVCFMAIRVHAQTCSVHGFILDDNLKPIPHAIVEVVGSYTMVESITSGFYSIIIPTGKHKLKVSATGYKPIEIEVNAPSILDVMLTLSNIRKKKSKHVLIPWDEKVERDTYLLARLADIHSQRKRYDDALSFWQEGDKQGDALCQYNIGIVYLHGYVGEVDLQKAYNYIQISALNEYDRAQLALGNSYCSGEFTHCDTTMAAYWYQRAASQGNAEAEKKLVDLPSAYKDKKNAPRKTCLAYIIGNSNYWRGKMIPIIKNDVELLASTLNNLGITTRLCTDLNRPQMLDSISSFAETAQNYDLALLYYSGLSAQSKGKNYLIPVGKKQQSSEAGILADCVDVDYIFQCLSDNGIDSKIVILDACRDNSSVFGRDDASHLGLSPSSLNPYGSFVAYAAQPNALYEEFEGEKHSPFLQALVIALGIPNLPIHEAFELVKTIVAFETGDRQVPVYMNNLKEKVVLNAGSQ